MRECEQKLFLVNRKTFSWLYAGAALKTVPAICSMNTDSLLGIRKGWIFLALALAVPGYAHPGHSLFEHGPLHVFDSAHLLGPAVAATLLFCIGALVKKRIAQFCLNAGGALSLLVLVLVLFLK